MTTLVLTYDQALASLQKAVEDRGADFVYPAEWLSPAGACLNFDPNTGEPRCIAGYVYHLNGKEYEQGWTSSTVSSLSLAGKLVADERTVTLLTYAQCAQDDHKTWGEALEIALQAVADLDARKAQR